MIAPRRRSWLPAESPRQREAECRADARLGLDLDAPPVALDDLLADREADAGAVIVAAAVQPLEQDEDALEVFSRDADAVVADPETAHLAVGFGRDVDAHRVLAPELQRIAEQVLEQLQQL